MASTVLTERPRIGCSGWNYKSWRGKFYAAEMPARQWLSYYTSVFDAVEINNTFYRLPEASTFACWKRQTPPGFLVAVKASRFLTHIKRLKDPEEPIDRLFARARPDPKLACTVTPPIECGPDATAQHLLHQVSLSPCVTHHARRSAVPLCEWTWNTAS